MKKLFCLFLAVVCLLAWVTPSEAARRGRVRVRRGVARAVVRAPRARIRVRSAVVVPRIVNAVRLAPVRVAPMRVGIRLKR